jgi:hypothetical protein
MDGISFGLFHSSSWTEIMVSISQLLMQATCLNRLDSTSKSNLGISCIDSFNDAVRVSDYTASKGRIKVINEFDRMWKWSWPNFRY